MAKGQDVRTIDDLERAVRALTRHFNCDTAIIIGSQAILVGWPNAPVIMRTSPEIDAYPANAREWEAARAAEGQDAEHPRRYSRFSVQVRSFTRRTAFTSMDVMTEPQNFLMAGAAAP